ncbi:MAG: biotin/lipoyl-binding protein [Prevotella sp.]|nr:biotin/lipoyl-binding protein [Prevotella sp.]
MSRFKYKIEGREYDVEITEAADNVVNVVVNGESFAVETERKAEPERRKPVLGQPETESADAVAATAANVNTNDALRAPLPGIITEIKVAVGDEVNAGDTLVVLEAMKMANNLDAEKSGKVTAICVKVGESVMEDAPLVVVE